MLKNNETNKINDELNLSKKDNKDLLKKVQIIIIGDTEVGKTQIINRIIQNNFQYNYKKTIGMNSFNKQIEIKNNIINLVLYDSSGQEKFKSLIEINVRESDFIFLVYDITNKDSFISINKYFEMIKDLKKENSLIFLLGNKKDLNPERKVDKKESQAYADKNNFLFHEISAKLDNDINTFFNRVIIPNIEKSIKLSDEQFNYNIEEINKLKKDIEILTKENQKLKLDLLVANKIISDLKNNKEKEEYNEIKEENLNLKNKIYFLKKKLEENKEEKNNINEIMFINFISTHSFIHCEIKCLPNDIFAEVEEKFYKKYNQYRNTNNIFTDNSKTILRFKTLKENNIYNGDIVQLFILK